MYNNMPKPDTFVLVVAALSEKLVQKENECYTLRQELTSAQEEVSYQKDSKEQMYAEVDNLRMQVANLSDANARQRNTISDMSYKAENLTYYQDRCAKLEEEVRALKYGCGDPDQRVRNFMLKEGGKLWSEGNKIACIKGVRECTGWGLKESKDYSEVWGPRYAPECEDCPKTMPSEDLARKAG